MAHAKDARTIYVDDKLWKWLQKQAETSNSGRPESVASLIRKVLDSYRAEKEKAK